MKKAFMGVAFLFSSMAWGGPAVQFEEVEVPGVPRETQSSFRPKGGAVEIKPLSEGRSIRSIHDLQEFRHSDDLRKKRRMGIGATAAGATGIMGAFLELNLTPAHSAIAAFGGGAGFNSFNFQWKYNFGGRNLVPYAGLGYARWYYASKTGANLNRTTPNILASRFLTEEQKRSGRFAVDLLNPNIGIQYSNLAGDYKGMGLFAEVDFLTSVQDFSPVPTGGVGILYYF